MAKSQADRLRRILSLLEDELRPMHSYSHGFDTAAALINAEASKLINEMIHEALSDAVTSLAQIKEAGSDKTDV